MARPKYTRKDTAHEPIRDELRDDGFVVIDVANLPGNAQHNPLDLVVMRTDVRQPPVIVATSAAGVRRWFDEHPDADMVQVEVKNRYTDGLTMTERLYFKWLGLYPPEVWT